MTALSTIEPKPAPELPIGTDINAPPKRTLPAERLYWSVVDGHGLARCGQVPPGILAEFALDLPVEVSTLHAVCTAVDGGRVVVCAAEREELGAFQSGGGPLVLIPASIPEFIAAAVNPAELNLLVGAFEPAKVRSARVWRHALRASGVLLLAGLVALGFWRRERLWRDQAAEARRVGSAVFATTAPGLRPAELAPTLAGYRQATQAAGALKPPADAALALTRLLAVWPTGQSAKPQSLGVSEQGISIALVVEGDPSAFIRSVTPPEGYRMDEPRLNAVGGGSGATRVNLQFRPVEQGAGR